MERVVFGEFGFIIGRLVEDGCVVLVDDDGLGVGEDGGDGEVFGVFDVYEEGVGSGYKGLNVVLVLVVMWLSRIFCW